MHFGDSIFIFLLALVLFGPKKLPEIGRTIGKLLGEFRRASNEFKFQIQEELRNMEEDERRKKRAELEAQKAAEAGTEAGAGVGTEPTATNTTPSILPPSTGVPVSTNAPYATPGAVEEVAPSAAEVVVEPSYPTESERPGLESELDAPAHVDLTAHGNGAHTSITNAEPIESDLPTESGVPSESIHHG